MFSLLYFVISNKDQYMWNLDVHERNTRYGLKLHPLTLHFIKKHSLYGSESLQLFTDFYKG